MEDGKVKIILKGAKIYIEKVKFGDDEEEGGEE
jgi:hypothetical protein